MAGESTVADVAAQELIHFESHLGRYYRVPHQSNSGRSSLQVLIGRRETTSWIGFGTAWETVVKTLGGTPSPLFIGFLYRAIPGDFRDGFTQVSGSISEPPR